MPVVTLENVSIVYHQRRDRMLLRDHLREHMGKQKSGFYALHDVSFALEKGETVGVVGANGAGKSTLLSLLAGLNPPDEGSAYLSGKVGAMLELGTGFHADLTGRENILVNAAFLGLSARETREAIPSIVEFSELAEFIDEPLRTYSLGMIVRLGFAITVHAKFDILLLDEILTVGDLAFQKKCYKHILSLKEKDKTLVCVSHVPGVLKELCHRLIWLHHGKLIADGDFATISARYQAFMSDPNRHLHDEIPSGPVKVEADKRTRNRSLTSAATR